MASIPGVDYPWSHPGGAALRAAGFKFACRYLSHDTGKNLSRAEADDLAAHGVWCVVVWESTASRALSGYSGGAADAHTALAQATACGMPAGRPVYFATDWDVTPSQQATVNAYLDGAASVLGQDRIGVYGGYYTVKRALDGGHAAYGWQTFAWSGGQWDDRAAIRQGYQKKINGVDVDLDTALVPDYGQWMPNKIPYSPEDNMALSAEDKAWFKTTIDASVKAAVQSSAYAAVLGKDAVPAPVSDPANPNWTAATYLKQLYLRIQEIPAVTGGGDTAALAELRKSVDALARAVTDPSGFISRLESELTTYEIKFEKES
jgi:hypothetical protein